MNEFSKDMRLVCTDAFASYVLQKIMTTVTERFLVKSLLPLPNPKKIQDVVMSVFVIFADSKF